MVSLLAFAICRGQKITEHIVIGTHGKLKNWLSKRTLDVAAIKILVFDEADQMLQVGRICVASYSVIHQNILVPEILLVRHQQ